ncbi:hypothetical protein JR316_0005559 [Psilocybe cubensis]|uniref:Uncharacterized protein n=2 Tax=Psilocybe cubensis TaxID=181762 RepID=A0A8H8CLG3_PSICU|nr:hypothetical protein JR316_0005559 [Psilocybe cubensis]KAH9481040.1 hypothetical protein JR316_0005559 [Psilocybe cubensis]
MLPILQRWHPKMTPYRLVVLLTTIGLGTAKAIMAHCGNSIVSTTLEWISGVLLFLILHGLSGYDSYRVRLPPQISWFFEYDCVEFAWRRLAQLRWLSIAVPEYSSDERLYLHMRNRYSKYPPVTLYRLLVSFTAVSFGMTKAYLSYAGLNIAATWTDWLLGVAATTCLYVVGLYEYNSVDMWHTFFVVDQSHAIMSISKATMYIGGITLSAAWCFGCLYGIHIYWRDPWLIFDAVITNGRKSEVSSTLTPTFIDDIHNFCLHLMMSAFILAASSVGIKFGAACYDEVWYVVYGSSVHMLAKRGRGYILRKIESILSSYLTVTTRRRVQRVFFSLWVCAGIAMYLVAIAGAFAMSIVWFGFTIRFRHRQPAPESENGSDSAVAILILYIFLISSSGVGLLCVGLALYFARSMVRMNWAREYARY